MSSIRAAGTRGIFRGGKRVWLLFLVAMLAGLGCQGKGEVSGTVTYQGKAVPFGTVLFEAEDGSIKQGNIGKDGKYSISEVTTGEVRVAVNSPDPKSSALIPIRGEGRVPDVPGWFPIPEKYNSVATSELTFPVKRGANTLNIELK